MESSPQFISTSFDKILLKIVKEFIRYKIGKFDFNELSLRFNSLHVRTKHLVRLKYVGFLPADSELEAMDTKSLQMFSQNLLACSRSLALSFSWDIKSICEY